MRNLFREQKSLVAREMGSPRRAKNRRRRTREGPEPVCVRAPLLLRVAHAEEREGGRGEFTSCRGLVGVVCTSSESDKEERPGCPTREQVVTTW